MGLIWSRRQDCNKTDKYEDLVKEFTNLKTCYSKTCDDLVTRLDSIKNKQNDIVKVMNGLLEKANRQNEIMKTMFST